MRTLIFTILLCAIFTVTYSQSVKLKPSNPFPRVGEKFNVDYVIESPEEIHIKNMITVPNELTQSKGQTCGTNNDFARGSISLNNCFNDTGLVSLGPFLFTVDGKEYKSDTIFLNIAPKLPNKKTGFWIRLCEYEGEHYLITEQRIVNDKEKTSNKPIMPNHHSFMGRDNGNYAIITDSTFKANNLIKTGHRSKSGTDFIEGEGDEQERQYSFKTMVIKIEASANYNNSFTLSKEHFENMPDNLDFNPIPFLIKTE